MSASRSAKAGSCRAAAAAVACASRIRRTSSSCSTPSSGISSTDSENRLMISAGSSADTYVPEPCRDSITPSAASDRVASRNELRETPRWSHSSGSGGNFAPGPSSPDAIICRRPVSARSVAAIAASSRCRPTCRRTDVPTYRRTDVKSSDHLRSHLRQVLVHPAQIRLMCGQRLTNSSDVPTSGPHPLRRSAMRHRSMFAPLTAALAAATLALTACGPGPAEKAQSGGEVKLQMVESLTNPTRTALLKKLIADFEAANSGVKVQLISPPTNQADQKIQQMLQSGKGVDVLEVRDTTVGPFSTNKWIYD